MQTVTLAAPFNGTLIAPMATVMLSPAMIVSSPNNLVAFNTFRGSLFARDINVQSGPTTGPAGSFFGPNLLICDMSVAVDLPTGPIQPPTTAPSPIAGCAIQANSMFTVQAGASLNQVLNSGVSGAATTINGTVTGNVLSDAHVTINAGGTVGGALVTPGGTFSGTGTLTGMPFDMSPALPFPDVNNLMTLINFGSPLPALSTAGPSTTCGAGGVTAQPGFLYAVTLLNSQYLLLPSAGDYFFTDLMAMGGSTIVVTNPNTRIFVQHGLELDGQILSGCPAAPAPAARPVLVAYTGSSAVSLGGTFTGTFIATNLAVTATVGGTFTGSLYAGNVVASAGLVTCSAAPSTVALPTQPIVPPTPPQVGACPAAATPIQVTCPTTTNIIVDTPNAVCFELGQVPDSSGNLHPLGFSAFDSAAQDGLAIRPQSFTLSPPNASPVAFFSSSSAGGSNLEPGADGLVVINFGATTSAGNGQFTFQCFRQ